MDFEYSGESRERALIFIQPNVYLGPTNHDGAATHQCWSHLPSMSDMLEWRAEAASDRGHIGYSPAHAVKSVPAAERSKLCSLAFGNVLVKIPMPIWSRLSGTQL